MSDTAKKARAAMKAKANRLASGDPKMKVDSSSWSPPEPLNADVKTGMRPVSKRQFKKGGKVLGKCEGGATMKRADRKARKSGGRTKEEQPLVDRYINRDVKKANEYRDGKKHIGGMKKGGKASDRTGKMGGGILGENPISQQNRSMGKAAGMAYKKGGKTKKEGGGRMFGEGEAAQHAKAERGMYDALKKTHAAEKVANNMADRGEDPIMVDLARKDLKKRVAEDVIAQNAETRARRETGYGLKKGGKAKHPDVKEDKALIKKMVKPEARTGKYAGGGVFSGDSKSKVPGATGGREAHKRGGKAKAGRGKTDIKIFVHAGGKKDDEKLGSGTMPNEPMTAPVRPLPVGNPIATPQGGPPAVMPPMGGADAGAGGPPMPPMPMGRKSGGRTIHVIDHAAGGARGRLEKIKAYGAKQPRC